MCPLMSSGRTTLTGHTLRAEAGSAHTEPTPAGTTRVAWTSGAVRRATAGLHILVGAEQAGGASTIRAHGTSWVYHGGYEPFVEFIASIVRLAQWSRLRRTCLVQSGGHPRISISISISSSIQSRTSRSVQSRTSSSVQQIPNSMIS